MMLLYTTMQKQLFQSGDRGSYAISYPVRRKIVPVMSSGSSSQTSNSAISQQRGRLEEEGGGLVNQLSDLTLANSQQMTVEEQLACVPDPTLESRHESPGLPKPNSRDCHGCK